MAGCRPRKGEVLRPRGWRLAWLEQSVEPSPRSALDFAVDGDRPLRAVERQIAAAEAAGDNDALARLHLRLEDAGGYDAEARAGEILHGSLRGRGLRENRTGSSPADGAFG